MTTIEPSEKSLVISCNCRAFLRAAMEDRVYLSHADNLVPRTYRWWELAVIRVYGWFACGVEK